MNTGLPPTEAGSGASSPRGLHEPPPGAAAMNVLRWVLFGSLLLLAIASIAGYALSRRPKGAGPAARAASVARYYCPMHPTYTSDNPGQCPICGMTLEPIPQHAGPEAAAENGDVPGLTGVRLTPDRVQMIGVRTAPVERRPLGIGSTLVGFVAPDESELRRVQIRMTGWVERLYVNRTGEVVRAGQPLVTIYSPELLQSENEYLIETEPPVRAARDSSEHAAMSEHELPGPVASRERLRLLGVPDSELERLARERTAATRLTLPSPVSGTVLERSVTEGQSVGPDTPLLTVADLSRVWVVADVYEMDLGSVRVGDPARFTADALPGRAFDARVEFVYPTVSSETRTLKARFSLDNRGGLLRPGMYGRVAIAPHGTPALTVPAEAVVHAGECNYVFLAHPGGMFEPRSVELGRGDGERVQVLRGVAAGDTVVASASFLIDSESRLKAAIDGLGGAPGAAPAGHAHGGTP